MEKRENSNKRYRNFTQTYFTAGDEEQFQKSRDYSDSAEISGDVEGEYWEGYKGLSGEDVTNTFRYLFHKFKKGIYIRIKDNKLVTFLPFSKAKFVNEWGDRIQVEGGDILKFLKHVSELDNRPFKPRYINKNTSGWYANNCLVRYEFPLSEGDTGTHHIQDMFQHLCETRKVPDIEFFVNRRDFPLLKRDGTEPYNHMWDDDAKPLVSHKYDRYVPILSCVTTSRFADVAIPTTEDWSRVRSFEGVKFPKTSDKWDYDFSTPWEERKPIAVFRGSSTGFGVTPETNPRLNIARMSSLKTLDSDGLPFLDAGITEWKVRPRKIQGEKFLKTIEHDKFSFKKVDRLTPEEQSRYKYIVNIDGHVSAFRLSLEMRMGCCILLVESDYKLWFSGDLKPYVHYVPVKRDLSDLIDRIIWCKSHDEECRKMAEECRKYYDNFLSKNSILDYLQRTIRDLKIVVGNYKYHTSPFTLQHQEEIEWINSRTKPLRDSPSYGVKMPNIGGNYPRFFNKFHALSCADFMRHLKLQTTSKKNNSSVVGYCTYGDFEFIVKTTTDEEKQKENIHEAFIGVNAINHLLKNIPNFAFTFGKTLAGDIVTEKISGISMMDWLNSDSFNFPEFKSILIQLSLALHVAQRECGFVHYDLFPWNVIIERHNREYIIDYVIQPGKVVEICTNIIPVIIDYGKSHVIFNGEHYGFVNMFKFSSVQDIMSIVLSSVNVMCKNHTLSKEMQTEVVNLVSFFKPAKNFYKACDIANECSFSGMLSSDKKDLEHIKPFDFAEKISKLVVKEKKEFNINIGSPRLFFDYSVKNNEAYNVSYKIPDFGGDRIKIMYYFGMLFRSFYNCKVPKKLEAKFQSLLESSSWPEIEIRKIPNLSIEEETFHNRKVIEDIDALPEADTTFLDYYDMLITILSYNPCKDIMSRYAHLISIDKPRDMANVATRNSVKKYKF